MTVIKLEIINNVGRLETDDFIITVDNFKYEITYKKIPVDTAMQLKAASIARRLLNTVASGKL